MCHLIIYLLIKKKKKPSKYLTTHNDSQQPELTTVNTVAYLHFSTLRLFKIMYVEYLLPILRDKREYYLKI